MMMPKRPSGTRILFTLVLVASSLPTLWPAGISTSSATVIRQVEGQAVLTCARTAEHVVDGRFGVPINVFFVDSRGETVRILLGKDGEVELRN